MKVLATVVAIVMLCGCSSDHSTLEQSTKLRENILTAQACSFETTTTAYYPNTSYQFQLSCSVDSNSTLSFSVISPDTISGICGQISNNGAALTFDEQLLAFPMMADNRLTPVSAPWVFYNTLRNGYLTGFMNAEDGFVLSIDDSFQDNPLHLLIHTDANCIPYYAEIYYQEQMVLSLNISNFLLV